MRKWIAGFGASVAIVGCATGTADEVATTSAQPTVVTTTAPETTTSSTTRQHPIGGHLVKLDIERFEPVPGLDPIPFGPNAWTITSDDGSWMAIVDWSEVTPIQVDTWTLTGTFDMPRHSARVIHGDRLYTYDEISGRLLEVDLVTGEESRLGTWRTDLWMWDELQVTSDGLIAGLGGRASDDELGTLQWVQWLDPATGESGEIEVGPIERIVTQTGVFDGDYEIPEFNTPGVVWGDDRLYIVHADGPQVTAVLLESGEVESHTLDATTWFDRLLAFWMPAASAKGPSMGTYSSAALTPNGRYLFISGNRYDVLEDADGALIEESEHLGLTVVDTETWEVAARPDLPVQFVRNAGDTIIAIDTRSTSPWLDDIYLLSTDESGQLSVRGPFLVEGGGCQPARDTVILLCSEYVGDRQRLRIVDTWTSETIDGLEIGQEDYVHDNGVLVDWSPIEG